MFMLEQRLQQQFFESADLQYQAAESLSRPLVDALQALNGCITSGGKTLVAGTGPSALLAARFADLLVGGFERARPPLAALALAPDAIATQVQALGMPGDLLLLIDSAMDALSLRAAIDAAHAKDMSVVALAPSQATWCNDLVETDVRVSTPTERVARTLELQLLMLHALADALDLQLMGEQDPE